VQTYGTAVDLSTEVQRYRPVVAELGPHLSDLLRGSELRRLNGVTAELAAAGVPADLAHDAAALLDTFSLLDVVRIAERVPADPAQVAALYFMVSERYEVDGFLTRISALPRHGRWQALARQALRSDLYQVHAALTLQVARSTDASQPALERLAQWETANSGEVSRVRQTLAEISHLERHDLASLSVALRALRTLVAQSRT
jgi:glutamate dehydrogenase